MPRYFLAVLLTFLLPAAASSGCSPDCEGISVDGRCETVCKDELCADGKLCVGNACRAKCKASTDCGESQTCEARTSDYGTEARFCTGARVTTTGGSGDPCTASSDCAERYGYRCIDQKCALTCEVHAQCGAQGSCTGTATDAEKRDVRTCEKDAMPRGKGQFGTSCPGGPDGDECDTKGGFFCAGSAGDVDAYCSRDCTSDDDCPAGLYCATEIAKLPPCDDVCTLTGQGPTDCVPSNEIGKGKTYSCGPVALLRSTCRVRDFCTPCQSDADCLGKANQICADDGSGQKTCTVLCDPAVNSCPWGSATKCDVWDQKLGKATCAHRFGSCTGTGKSCEPCVEQGDCPNGFCQEAQFTGERYCVDLTAECSCPDGTEVSCRGGGCPTTPASRPMKCLGGTAYETSALFGACFGADTDVNARSSKEGCWPAQ